MEIKQYVTLFDSQGLPKLFFEAKNEFRKFNNLDSPEKVFEFMKEVYQSDLLTEEFVWLLALNSKNVPTGIFEISHGTASFAVVEPREVFMRLLLCGATRFIIVQSYAICRRL